MIDPRLIAGLGFAEAKDGLRPEPPKSGFTGRNASHNLPSPAGALSAKSRANASLRQDANDNQEILEK